jgi:hypothetical protein
MTSPNAQKIPEPKLPIQAATRERAIDSLIARLRPLTSKSIRCPGEESIEVDLPVDLLLQRLFIVVTANSSSAD